MPSRPRRHAPRLHERVWVLGACACVIRPPQCPRKLVLPTACGVSGACWTQLRASCFGTGCPTGSDTSASPHPATLVVAHVRLAAAARVDLLIIDHAAAACDHEAASVSTAPPPGRCAAPRPRTEAPVHPAAPRQAPPPECCVVQSRPQHDCSGSQYEAESYHSRQPC